MKVQNAKLKTQSFLFLLTTIYYLLSTGLFAQPQRSISLSFEDADIKTVLRTFAKLGGVNIVASENVTGRITIELKNVPWTRAFETVLKVHGLSKVEKEGIIGIMTMQELESQKRVEALETWVIVVKYANAEAVKTVIAGMLTERGTAETDLRTNSLIMTDIPGNLKKLKKLIEEIDTPTRQVMINAKIVEIDYKVKREIGINWMAGDLSEPTRDTHFGGGVSTPVTEAAKFVFGTLQKGVDIDVILSMLEEKNKVNILIEPRIAVCENEQARIMSGKKVPVLSTDEAGNTIVKFYDVAVKLDVTPHIHPDGRIMLDIRPEIADLSSEATVAGGIIFLTSWIETKLLVENGQTAVIGGVTKTKTSVLKKGVPFLSSIPLIGQLFSSKSTVTDKSEIMIFITPEIIPIK